MATLFVDDELDMKEFLEPPGFDIRTVVAAINEFATVEYYDSGQPRSCHLIKLRGKTVMCAPEEIKRVWTLEVSHEPGEMARTIGTLQRQFARMGIPNGCVRFPRPDNILVDRVLVELEIREPI